MLEENKRMTYRQNEESFGLNGAKLYFLSVPQDSTYEMVLGGAENV